MAENTIGLTRIQKLIGRRMLEAKLTKPCFYLYSKADISKVMQVRQTMRKTYGVKVSTNSFYIKAAANSAKLFPLMVARIEDDIVKIADSINVGFAVDAPHGLVVPVIKQAHEKSLLQIGQEEIELTEKALDNKLSPTDMDGQTICTTNLGAYNIDSFIAIIPPLSSAILSLGKVNREIFIENGQPVQKKMLTMVLSVDHKVINGDYAARFMRSIVGQLENPAEMM